MNLETISKLQEFIYLWKLKCGARKNKMKKLTSTNFIGLSIKENMSIIN